MADFIMPETQQPMIIYSLYLLKDLLEYISGRIASYMGAGRYFHMGGGGGGGAHSYHMHAIQGNSCKLNFYFPKKFLLR